jgi:hypothetical protein
MVFRDRARNIGRRNRGGFVPGAQVRGTTQEMGSLPNRFIGEFDGSGVGQMNDVGGSAVGRRPMVQDLPGRRIDTSHRAGEMDSRMSAVLQARRQNKINAAGPGLSDRGVRNAPGRGARPVTGGLERKGVRPAPGTRSAGRPAKVRGGTLGGNTRSGMGMGIPGGAPTGGGMPAQYGRGYASGFGDMGMGIPSNTPTGGGLPAQYGRKYGGSFGDMGMGIPRNAPTGGGLPSQYGRIAKDIPGGTPVHIRPRGAPAGGGGTVRAAQELNEDVIKGLGKKGKLLSNRGLLIGAGAAVIAGLAMNRRGDGTSSGRSSMTKY